MSDEQPRPTVITLMAEHGVQDPAWDRPSGTGDPLDLPALGVSAALVRRLRDWNGALDVLSTNDFEWPSPDARTEWERTGLELALELQDELEDTSPVTGSAGSAMTREYRWSSSATSAVIRIGRRARRSSPPRTDSGPA